MEGQKNISQDPQEHHEIHEGDRTKETARSEEVNRSQVSQDIPLMGWSARAKTIEISGKGP